MGRSSFSRGALDRQFNPTITGLLTMATAASVVVPGATSLNFNNNANNATNLTITDAGIVTVARSTLSLTVGPLKFDHATGIIVGGSATTNFNNNANNANNCKNHNNNAISTNIDHQSVLISDL